MSDRIIDDLIEQHPGLADALEARDAKRRKTYGDSLRGDTCTTDELERHLLEELLETMIYAEALYQNAGTVAQRFLRETLILECAEWAAILMSYKEDNETS